MSNTKKITASRKKRREKGSRAEFLGSNPHSKGEAFSRSWVLRLARTQEMKKIALATTTEIAEKRKVRSIH